MGTLQGEFDRCYTFQTLVGDALALVQTDWESVADADALDLSEQPEEDWDTWLEALDHGFVITRQPAGLDAGQLAAWQEECNAIKWRSHVVIRRKAREIRAGVSTKAALVASALVHLNLAKTAYLAGDTLDGRWLVDVLMGVHEGLEAGGASAFAAGADRTLYSAALNFARDNAAHLLEVIDATAERPSDAVGLQIFREARERLVAFLAG